MVREAVGFWADDLNNNYRGLRSDLQPVRRSAGSITGRHGVPPSTSSPSIGLENNTDLHDFDSGLTPGPNSL